MKTSLAARDSATVGQRKHRRPASRKSADLGASECPVTVKGLQKAFGDQRVLNGIDLTVAAGETVAVLGRSGSGKSVLLRLLVGLQAPDGGEITICGQPIGGLK